MDEGTGRDVHQRQSVAGLDVSVGTGFDGVADFEANRSDDVALLAVFVLHEGDVSAAVRIVFEGEHSRGHVNLVALEVDDTILLTVTAAAMTDGDAAVAVTAGLLRFGSEQALFGTRFRQTAVIQNGHIAAAGRSRLIVNSRHSDSLSCS